MSADNFGHPITNDSYWASKEIEELLPILDLKIEGYKNYIVKSGRLMRWRMVWETYMKAELRIGVIYGGGRAQYKILSSNIFRSIVEGLVSVICNQRPSFEPQVINDDSKSLSQDEVASSVLDYYLKVKYLEDLYRQSTTYGLLFGEGWLYERWDASIGEVVDVNLIKNPDGTVQKIPKFAGDVQFDILSPMDVIKDYTRLNTDNDWFIVRQYLNKWDLIAMRPDLKDELATLTIPQELQRFRFGHYIDGANEMDDLIPVYTFMHEKTKACPNGRLVQFVNNKTMIIDTGLPYDEIPMYPMYPDTEPMANFGATVMVSLVHLQRAYDAGMSIITTNQQTFGIQNIAIDSSSNIKPEQVMDGVNWLKTDLSKGIPQAIQLCKTAEEIFTQLDRLESQMEKLSGLPSILRGTPPTGVTSGTAMAYLQAQALVFNTPLQQSYISMLEHSASGLFEMLKSFADTKRIITIVGSSKASYTQEFTGKDLMGIKRVIVNAGNPVIQTEAGKLQTANDLLQKGLITTPQEYFSVLNDGNLESMTAAVEKELILIKKENERLMQGQPCVVAPGNNHPLHIREHQIVIMEQQLKFIPNDPILKAAFVHQENHLNAMTPGNPNAADPRLLSVLGIPPFPAPAPQQAPTTQIAQPLAPQAPAASGGTKPSAPPLPPGGNVSGGNPVAPHAAVLPRNTPAPVANAAASTGAHLPISKPRPK